TTGATKHYELERKWKTGTSGTAYLDGSRTYDAASIAVGDSDVVRPVAASVTEYTQEVTSGTTGANTTTYTNTFYSSALAIEKVVTTYPVVSTGTNGSNSATTASRYFDETGRVTFTKSPGAIIGYTAYTKGQATTRVEDADTTETGVGEVFYGVSIPTGFSSSGTPLHRVATMTYDAQGRSSATTAVDGQVFLTYYSRLADHRGVTLRYADYDSGAGPKYYGPVSYAVANQAGSAEVSGTIGLTSNESTTALTGHIDETDADPITAADLGTVVRLSTSVYNESGYTLEESRAYFDIPGSGAGSDGTNYDGTFFAYDAMGRQIRTLEPSGTIHRTDFDEIGRAEASWIGTNDYGEVGGSGSGPNNMTQTSATVFDGGADGGNSLVTTTTSYIDSSTGYDTDYTYDVRGRALLVENPTAPHSFSKYDNLGRMIATGLFSSVGGITVGSDDPTSETGSRLALSQTFFDELGRTWKSQRHNIDAADGSDDDNLQSLTWYDAEGRVVKVDGGQLAKTLYDRIGRATHQFVLASDNDSVYADTDDVSGDIVLTERQTVFEDGGDDVLLQLVVDRFHNDYGGGETTGALDTNADNDRLLVTQANLEGRPQITTHWYDRFGRTIDTVRYGTNGGSNLDRDGLSAPASDEDHPRRTFVYRNDGTVETETDPLGRDTLRAYDDLGRLVTEVRNYDAGVNSGNPSGTDDNVTVRYEYTDGLQTAIIADVPSGGTDQETTYAYGTTKGASAGDSKIATGHLLQEVVYPDSGGASDTVTYAYDARGAEILREDQAGNVVERVLDASGRETARKVTTLDGDFDGAVRRIETAYDSLGRASTVIQYDAASSGNVVDGVAFAYDGWGNVLTFEQDRDSAVGAGGSVNDYQTSYTYAKATTGRNTVRRTSMTLPSGNVLDYTYASGSGALDDEASRVTNVWDGVRVVAYKYLGVGQVVNTDYLAPKVYHDLIGGGTSYTGLDAFNRVARDIWSRFDTAEARFFDTSLRYDAAGNILSSDDDVHAGFDVGYAIDDTDRLTRAHEGTLSAGSIGSPTRDQQWTLDHLGNWDVNKVDLDGDSNFNEADEENDDRTHNDVNELTTRDIDDDSSVDYTLAYDEVGNLTDDGESYEYVWDAFGRMRKILDRSDDSVVAELRYNGLGFWIAIHEDTDDDDDVDGSDLWYYHAYDERWRQVATFRSSDTSPKEEFVPHQAGADGRGGSSYIDLVAWRDKDANTAWTSASDGVLEERSFYCQNYHADVVARVSNAGYMLEWVKYSAYGIPFGLPGGDADSDGDCDSADITQIDTWVTSGPDDVRGDVDLDGDVEASDKSTVQVDYEGIFGGRWSISSHGNRNSFQGSPVTSESLRSCTIRARTQAQDLGRWHSRDPVPYMDGVNLYAFLKSEPHLYLDPSGTTSQFPLDLANPNHSWHRANPSGAPMPKPPASPPPPPPNPVSAASRMLKQWWKDYDKAKDCTMDCFLNMQIDIGFWGGLCFVGGATACGIDAGLSKNFTRLPGCLKKTASLCGITIQLSEINAFTDCMIWCMIM
ncbi:MAG TPA: RHS repeat-associated core domain-containing protein, partial [Planctomycetota bacterium]|nr:RHS repeat-associated core domain-containing protein [Planctomycetota bacterium]